MIIALDVWFVLFVCLDLFIGSADFGEEIVMSFICKGKTVVFIFILFSILGWVIACFPHLLKRGGAGYILLLRYGVG